MKNRRSWIVVRGSYVPLLLMCAVTLAADAPKEQEQGYVLVPAALWSNAVDLLERQQQAIEALREQLRKTTCKEV